MKEISESTNEELLNIKKWLMAVIIVTPILLIAFLIISYLTGPGSVTTTACIMIPNAILCYFGVTKIDKELKSREIN